MIKSIFSRSLQLLKSARVLAVVAPMLFAVSAKARMTGEQPTLFLNANQFLAGTHSEQVAYIKALRDLLAKNERNQSLTFGENDVASPATYALLSTFFSEALAEEESTSINIGDECFFAGNVSKVMQGKTRKLCSANYLRNGEYTADLIRGGFEEAGLNTKMTCTAGKIPCNPLFYGYRADGNPICVPYLGATNACGVEANRLDPKLDKVAAIWQKIAKVKPENFDRLKRALGNLELACKSIKITQHDCRTTFSRAAKILKRYEALPKPVAAQTKPADPAKPAPPASTTETKEVANRLMCKVGIGDLSKEVRGSAKVTTTKTGKETDIKAAFRAKVEKDPAKEGDAEKVSVLLTPITDTRENRTYKVQNKDGGSSTVVFEDRAYSVVYENAKYAGKIRFKIDNDGNPTCEVVDSKKETLTLPVAQSQPCSGGTDWKPICVSYDKMVSCHPEKAAYSVTRFKKDKFEVKRGDSKVADVEIKKDEAVLSNFSDKISQETWKNEIFPQLFFERNEKAKKASTAEADVRDAIKALKSDNEVSVAKVEEEFNKADAACNAMKYTGKGTYVFRRITDSSVTKGSTYFACGVLEAKGVANHFYGPFLKIYKVGDSTRIATGGTSPNGERVRQDGKTKNGQVIKEGDPGQNGEFYPNSAHIYRIGDKDPYMELTATGRKDKFNIYSLEIDNCPGKFDDYYEKDRNVIMQRTVGTETELIVCEGASDSGPWKPYVQLKNPKFSSETGDNTIDSEAYLFNEDGKLGDKQDGLGKIKIKAPPEV